MLDRDFQAHAVDDRTSFCLQLAAEELFTNMLRHDVGGGERISVRLDVNDERVQLDLVDHDVEPFDPDSVPPVDVTLPPAQRHPGGLGMHLVRSLVDRVSYRYQNRDLEVSVVKRLEK